MALYLLSYNVTYPRTLVNDINNVSSFSSGDMSKKGILHINKIRAKNIASLK